MSESNESVLPDWAKDVKEFPKPFKIKDGESKTFKFVGDNDGEVYHDKKNNKDDIIFIIEEDGIQKTWYVNMKSWSTKKEIAKIGFPLKGKTVTLSRKGAGRFDTQYFITLNK